MCLTSLLLVFFCYFWMSEHFLAIVSYNAFLILCFCLYIKSSCFWRLLLLSLLNKFRTLSCSSAFPSFTFAYFSYTACGIYPSFFLLDFILFTISPGSRISCLWVSLGSSCACLCCCLVTLSKSATSSTLDSDCVCNCLLWWMECSSSRSWTTWFSCF